MNWLHYLAALFLLIIFIEPIIWSLRFKLVHRWSIYKPKALGYYDSVATNAIVLPSDIDRYLHMNNSRYLRHADFARLDWFVRMGLYDKMKLANIIFVQGSFTIRYRRSLAPFASFRVETRAIEYRDNAIIYEQLFINNATNFVHAVGMGQFVMQTNKNNPVQNLEDLIGKEDFTSGCLEIDGTRGFEAHVQWINMMEEWKNRFGKHAPPGGFKTNHKISNASGTAGDNVAKCEGATQTEQEEWDLISTYRSSSNESCQTHSTTASTGLLSSETMTVGNLHSDFDRSILIARAT